MARIVRVLREGTFLIFCLQKVSLKSFVSFSSCEFRLREGSPRTCLHSFTRSCLFFLAATRTALPRRVFFSRKLLEAFACSHSMSCFFVPRSNSSAVSIFLPHCSAIRGNKSENGARRRLPRTGPKLRDVKSNKR